MFNCILLNTMNRTRNSNQQETAFQRWDLRTRRLRLITDVMEDYQDNVRRMIRLMGCELGISNHVYNNSMRPEIAEEWMHRVSQATTDMYSAETPRSERRQQEPRNSPIYEPEHVPYSFNEMPPPSQRRYIYTQMSGAAVNSGINSEQIDSSTEQVQYDGSMNESRCPISWDSFTVGQNVLRINSCGHIFCENALRQWFTNHNVCPVCRTVVGGSANLNTVDPSGNNPTTSTVINQILTGIINSLNGSPNTNQIYESEVEFNFADLMNAYTQLNLTQPSNNQNP